jgi:PAS domain S-box-containing protein
MPIVPERTSGGPRAGHPAQNPGPPEFVPTGSELRYRRLFEAARGGILILDAEAGRIIDANPFMTELLGFEYGDFLGKELWEIGLFEDQEANRSAYEILREDGYIRYEHLPLRTKTGQEVEVEFVSNLYLEGDSRVIQCNIRDITARRLLEWGVQEQSEALEESSRRKDEFLAILSHELRNPLGSILNSVQLFQRSLESDSVQKQAKAIVERQVGQLIHLVDDLLEVTRISTGAVVLQLEPCDAGRIIRGAIGGMAHVVAKHGHRLIPTIPMAPIWLSADPTRIEQVVTNLIGNAVKYTDAGGRIDVSLAQEGAEMVLRVKDNGIGISPELLPRLFDLFTQADRSLVRSQGGLGIGLTIVQRLVKMHKGTVEATSPGLGRGSEFIVRLPTREFLPSEAVPPIAPAMRILIVDDNIDYAQGIALLLLSAGYVVEVAHDGPQALQSLPYFRPDVVVLDVGLPTMDGYEVARRIREAPGHESTRIVGVSGYRQEPDGPRGQAARFDAYLMKPIILEQLEASLKP